MSYQQYNKTFPAFFYSTIRLVQVTARSNKDRSHNAPIRPLKNIPEVSSQVFTRIRFSDLLPTRYDDLKYAKL